MPFRRIPLLAALLVLTALAVPSRAAAPFGFARRLVGTVASTRTRTYAVPAGAVLAGVTWTAGDAAVYVRRDAGAWEALENDAPVTGGRPGTEPYWLDRGTALLAVRIVPRGTVSGAAVDFVGGGTPTRTASASAPETRTLPRIGAVVTRRGWGADERLRSGGVEYATPKALILHHTVTSNDYSQAEAASYVRAVYGYHTRSRGWSDIGYNLVVDRFGTIYEGRYGGFDRGVVGAHTAGFNTGTLGISLLGNYDVTDTPAPMVAAVVRAGAWAVERWRFDPRGTVTLTSHGSPRFRSGTRVTVSRLSGHRDLGTTACPGRFAYDRLPALRTAIWREFRAVISRATVDGAPVRSPQPVKVTASIDKIAYWTAVVTDDAGAPLATVRGHGRRIAVSWDGVMPNGLPAWPGQTFRYVLTADDRVHGVSDPVRGTFSAGLPAAVPV